METSTIDLLLAINYQRTQLNNVRLDLRDAKPDSEEYRKLVLLEKQHLDYAKQLIEELKANEP